MATHINGDDAPSLTEWVGGETESGDSLVQSPLSTVAPQTTHVTGEKLRQTLKLAGGAFLTVLDSIFALFFPSSSLVRLVEQHGQGFESGFHRAIILPEPRKHDGALDCGYGHLREHIGRHVAPYL